MKTFKFYALLGTVLVAMLFIGCSKDDDTDVVLTPTTADLSDAEKSGLLQMVEIEKLHRDVYQAMLDINQCQLFGDLCNCDGNFMDLLAAKVDKYKLENPLNGRQAGVYANSQIQMKYIEFLNLPENKLNEMLAFAKQLEENALTTAETHLTQVNGNDDIAEIYTNILEESKCQLESIITKIEHRDPVEHPGNLPDDI